MKFIDTHAHLTCNELYLDIDPIMKRAKEAGLISVVNICTDKMTLERGILAKKRHSELFNAGCTTPHDATKLGQKEFAYFEKAAKEGHLIAIGETGLDYHRDYGDPKVQQALFIRYLKLATECNLPILIHCREAFDDLFAILDSEYGKSSVLLHCFTGTKEQARSAIERGYMISMSGILTFKRSNDLREVAKEIPIENLVIETDSPYLAPEAHRSKRNEPAFAKETLRVLLELKGADLSEQLIENTKKFFKI
jgi:TatD DNase family protein